MKVIVCKGCKHSFTATDAEGNPACPVCIGISPDSGILEEVEVPDTAHCVYCKQAATFNGEKWHIGNDKPAGREGYRNMDVMYLPFYRASDATYFCGCMGWD